MHDIDFTPVMDAFKEFIDLLDSWSLSFEGYSIKLSWLFVSLLIVTAIINTLFHFFGGSKDD